MIITDTNAILERVRAFSLESREPPLYPGATRVLSGTKDMTGLNAWRERIGEDKADAILKESLSIGTSLDKIVEAHFSNPEFDPAAYRDQSGYRLYKQILPHLRKIESATTQLTVWSDRAKMKGIMDIFGLFNGEPTVIDIKNSIRPKKEEYIEDYFLQCTMYAMAMHDLLGVSVKKIALIIAVRPGDNHLPIPQVFVRDTKDFVKEALRRIRDYHSTHDYLIEKGLK